MEYTGSREESTCEVSIAEVGRADIYVGIFAERYGSGITKDEYDRARELKLPIFIYFKNEKNIPVEMRETDPKKISLLAAFKEELCKPNVGHTVTTFTAPDNLAACFTADWHRWFLDTYLPALRREPLLKIQEYGLAEGTIPLRVDLRRHFDRLLDDYALFGGRDDEMDAIDGFLADLQGGYLFVTCPSGYGKTALLAQIARQKEVVYHFIHRGYGTVDKDLFLRNLCQQLATRHGLGGRLPVDIAELQALYLDLLHLPPTDGKQVVVLIDGLDETINWEPNTQLFPPDLPDRVKVIFSAREVAERDWPRHLGLPPGRVRMMTLGAMKVEDVKSLLRAAGGVAAPLADDVTWIHEALRVSEGDPFYVKLIVEDVLTLRMLPSEIGKQPTGLDGYLKGWWDQIARTVRNQDVRDLLGSLAVARGRLRRDDLVRMFPKLGWTLDSVLAEIRRFIIGNYQEGYALCHPRFAKHVQGWVGAEALQNYIDVLLDYCARWRDHRSVYALQHYAEHLRAARHYSPLFVLARDEVFLQEQAKAFADEPDLPLRTVQTALKGAAENDNAGKMAEFLMIHARRVQELTKESPLTALRAGSIEGAWRLADLFEIDLSVLWYLLLAWELKDEGRIADAQKTLGRLCKKEFSRLVGWTSSMGAYLLAHTSDINEDAFIDLDARLFSDYNCRTLCEYLVNFGLVDTAVATALRRERDKALIQEVMIASIRAGDFDAADTLAEKIENAGYALERVVGSQVEAGKLEAAIKTADRIADKSWRGQALQRIVEGYLNSGDLNRAIEISESIEPTYYHVMALGSIAVTQAQRGAHETARSTLAAAIEYAQVKEEQLVLLPIIAGFQVKTGEIDSAFETLQSLQESGKYWGFRNIPKALAEQGEFAKAVDTANMIEDKNDRASALQSIAQEQVKARRYDAALETVKLYEKLGLDETSFDFLRKETLHDIAVSQAQDGELKAALETARTIENPEFKEKAQADISIYQAQTKNYAAALEIAQSVEGSHSRARALWNIAAIQAEAGEFDAAIATAQGIKKVLDYSRNSALQNVAEWQEYSGQGKAARSTVAFVIGIAPVVKEAEEEKPDQAEVMAAIATAQAEAGYFEDAYDTASRIDRIKFSTQAFGAIAVALSRAGKHNEAMSELYKLFEEAQGLNSAAARTLSLQNIAAALAQIDERNVERDVLDAAAQEAKQIEEANFQVWIQSEIADAQIRTGDHDAGRSTFIAAATNAQKNLDIADSNIFLRNIARKQAEAGLLADAVATARMVEPNGLLNTGDVLQDIAVEQAKASDFDAAVKIALSIEAAMGPGPQEEALEKVTEVASQLRKFEVAFGIVQRIKDKFLFERALQVIATEQAKARDLPAAFGTMQRIQSGLHRAIALGKIAAEQARFGDREKAKSTFADAITAAKEVENGHLSGGFADIAKAQVEANEFASAIETTQWIEDDRERAETLAQIAIAQAKEGFREEALRTTEGILINRKAHLPEVASAFAGGGDKEGFKGLLIPCAYYLDAVYKICSLIAQLYPDQGALLARAVSEFI